MGWRRRHPETLHPNSSFPTSDDSAHSRNLKRPPISPHCLVIHLLPLLISPLSTRLPLFSEKLSQATIKYRAAGKKEIAAPLPFCHIFEQLRIDFEINPGGGSRRGCGREAASGARLKDLSDCLRASVHFFCPLSST